VLEIDSDISFPDDDESQLNNKNNFKVLINSIKLKNFLEKEFVPHTEKDKRKKERVMSELMAVQTEKVRYFKKQLEKLKKSQPSASIHESRKAQISRIEKLLKLIELSIISSKALPANKPKLTEKPNEKSNDKKKLFEMAKLVEKAKLSMNKDKTKKVDESKLSGDTSIARKMSSQGSGYKYTFPLTYKSRIVPSSEQVAPSTNKKNPQQKSEKQPAVPQTYKFVAPLQVFDIGHGDKSVADFVVKSMPTQLFEHIGTHNADASHHNTGSEDDEEDVDKFEFDKFDILNQDPRSLVGTKFSPLELIQFDIMNNQSESNITMSSLNLLSDTTSEYINPEFMNQEYIHPEYINSEVSDIEHGGSYGLIKKMNSNTQRAESGQTLSEELAMDLLSPAATIDQTITTNFSYEKTNNGQPLKDASAIQKTAFVDVVEKIEETNGSSNLSNSTSEGVQRQETARDRKVVSTNPNHYQRMVGMLDSVSEWTSMQHDGELEKVDSAASEGGELEDGSLTTDFAVEQKQLYEMLDQMKKEKTSVLKRKKRDVENDYDDREPRLHEVMDHIEPGDVSDFVTRNFDYILLDF
jgi:hypothetical protein